MDLAAIGGPPPEQFRLQLGANLALPGKSAIALSWVDFKTASMVTQLATASYTRALGPTWFLSTTALYDPAHAAVSLEAFLTFQLDKNVIGTMEANAGAHSHDIQLSAALPADPDGGVGYRISAARGDLNNEQGGVTIYGPDGNLDAALSSTNGRVASQVSYSGGIVAIGGSVFATPRPDGAIALVRTGQPGVRVERENRQVAITDADGDALLTQLVPNVRNHIAVDTQDFPIGTVLDRTDAIAIPPRQSGIIVDLTPPRRRPLLFSLMLLDGEVPPAGARVTLTGIPGATLVGRHGEVFLDDLKQPTTGFIEFGSRSCRFAVAAPAASIRTEIAHAGPIICALERHDL
jgi:outer membrane usher protein